MALPTDQIEGLKSIFSGVKVCDEGGVSYILIPSLALPPGCMPEKVAALLCPTVRDNYASRLFFAEQIKSPTGRNWNANSVRILEQNWHAFSWQVSTGLSLAQLVT